MNHNRISPLASALLILFIAFVLFLIYLAIASLLSARNPIKPLAGAEWMSVPRTYPAWYEKTAQCAQLPNLDYHKIEWYVVPDVVTFSTDIGEKVALWEDLGDGYSRITVSGYYVENEMVVRHEMLHDLLNRYGAPTGHPALYFEERCGLTWQTWKGHTP
jgi:hypothetical protein